MTRLLIVLLVGAGTVAAQPPDKGTLLQRTEELDNAIRSGDWGKAAELSRELKSATEDARNRSMAAAGKKQTESILSWLPADTETVLVAQQPFEITLPDQTKPPKSIDAARGLVLGLLESAEKEKLFTDLAGRTVRLAAIGARRFGEEPEDHQQADQRVALGMIRYQGCAIYAFAAPLPQPLLNRPAEDTILGYPTWVSKGSQNEQPDRDQYFVSMLMPDVMLVCNNRAFFQEMAEGMGPPSPQRALPPDLPEWKLVDRTAPLWGLTHYRNSRTASLGTDRGDLGAVGLTVQFGLADDTALARMIAKADPWNEIISSPDFHGAAQSSKTSDGAWELRISGQPEAAGFGALLLMGQLGFEILL